MRLLSRYRLQCERAWLRWILACDYSLRETTDEAIERNHDRLRRVQMRLAQVTPAHLMMREMGK